MKKLIAALVFLSLAALPMSSQAPMPKDEAIHNELRMLSGPNKVVSSYSATVNVDELTILYGGSTGISFGSAIEHFKLNDGRMLDLPARWSATLVKDGDKWLIVSLHASDDLFDNPLLAIAKRTAYWAGGVALVVGLIAGFAIGRRRKEAR